MSGAPDAPVREQRHKRRPTMNRYPFALATSRIASP
jgi:hypothetical protein